MAGLETVVALVASTATAAVHGAYTELRRMVGDWAAGPRRSLLVLEADEVGPDVWQARLEEEELRPPTAPPP